MTWHFIATFSTFIKYFLKVYRLPGIWLPSTTENYRFLAWPPNIFRVVKKVSKGNLPLCKNYMSTKLYQQNVRFYIYCECSFFYPRLHHKASVALQTHIQPALAFSLDLADVISAFYTCPNSVVLIILPEKNIESVIVLETYVTHDVIGSNLVLIWYYAGFSVTTFLNWRK